MAIGPDYSVRPYADKYARDETPVSESDLRSIQKMADNVDSKKWGIDTRYSISSSMRLMDEVIKDTLGRQDEVEGQFQDVIENTTDKDVISAPEIINARNGEPNLKARLDKENQEVTAQLAHKANMFVSVTDERFGAKGDGITNDSEAIQTAVDYVYSRGGGTVFFPNLGKPYVLRNIKIKPNVNFLGQNTVLLKTPWDGEATAGDMKWWRMFTIDNAGSQGYTNGPFNLQTIEGLIFDGNQSNMNWDGTYSQEQGHCLFLAGNINIPERVRFMVNNCQFRNSVGDGLSSYANVELIANNISSQNCFRGGFVSTGGHSIVTLSNSIIDESGIDVETDGAGYEGSTKSDITFSNLHIGGDFDCGVTGGSVVLGNNITCEKPSFNILAVDSTIKISNSKFAVGRLSSGNNRITFPSNVEFSNCEFVIEDTSVNPDGKFAPIHIYWNTSGSSRTNQLLRFLNCNFSVGESVSETATTYAFYSNPDMSNYKNRLEIINCNISQRFNSGVYILQGGTVLVKDTRIESGDPLHFRHTTSHPLNIELDNVDVSGSGKFCHIDTLVGYELLSKNITVDETDNVISSSYGIDTTSSYKGSRTIWVSNDPTTTPTPGLIGDRCVLKSPIAEEDYEWVCVIASTSNATWKVSKTLGA